MTMCLMERFTIGGKAVGTRSARNIDEDTLDCYAVTEVMLVKKMLQPNELTFTLRRHSVDKTAKTSSFDIVKDIIGQEVDCKVTTSISCSFKTDGPNASNIVNLSSLEFKGTVAKVSMKGISLVCIAYSKDSKLQGPPKSRCFTGMSIDQIVDAVIPVSNPPSQDDIQKTIALHSVFQSKPFPLIVQYNESDYDFLVRLAKRFGAFFYFDKTSHLVFGKLPNGGVINVLPKKATSFSYELQTGDPNLRLSAYQYEKNLTLTSTPDNYSALGAVNLVKMAVDHSEATVADYKFFVDNPQSLYVDQAADAHSKALLATTVDDFVTCKFTCYQFDLDIGSLITIAEAPNLDKVLLVTSICFTWDCEGSPQSEVNAIVLPKSEQQNNTDNIYPPYTDINVYPRSNAQRAVVLNNKDPKKMGRVQVLFSWQQPPADQNQAATLPWIRISQPYGGNNKGFYILPEIGEEVMVGFEHENLEKPFVIGTLFHDSNTAAEKQMPDAAWVEDNDNNKENEVKSFRSKKGHTIEFHDTKEGDGFIRIYGNEKSDQPNYDIILSTDKIQQKEGDQKNDLQLDSADDEAKASENIKEKKYKAEKLRILVRSNGGDIMLDAGDGDIFLNANNIHINARGNSTSLIQGKRIVKVGGEQHIQTSDTSLLAANVKLDAEESMTMKVKKAVQLETKDTLEINANTITAESTQGTTMQANEMKFEAKSNLELGAKITAKVKAEEIQEEADMTTIKGQIVTLDGKSTTLKGTNMVIDTSMGTRKGTWMDV